MSIKRVVLFMLFAVLLNSCIPYRYIDIQYYDKTKQNLPINKGKVLVVANLYNRELSNKKEMMEWALDSVAVTTATESLNEILLSSPMYDGLETINKVYYRNDTSKVILPLSWNELSRLSARNDSVNLIVSLDYMRINPYSDCIPRWVGSVKEFYGYLDVAVYCYWRVYDLSNRKITNSYLYRDTLSWEATDWTEVKIGNQLPGVFTATAYAGADAAEKYASLIAPTWKNDTRILFNTGSKLFIQAEKLAEHGQWLDAAALWQKLTSDKNTVIAAKAAFNMALANEMLGNFEVAIDWLDEAQRLNPQLKEIDDYRDIINGRIDANE
ncbi:MAG: DUF6340 family protein [Bacteroidales bacterium]